MRLLRGDVGQRIGLVLDSRIGALAIERNDTLWKQNVMAHQLQE